MSLTSIDTLSFLAAGVISVPRFFFTDRGVVDIVGHSSTLFSKTFIGQLFESYVGKLDLLPQPSILAMAAAVRRLEVAAILSSKSEGPTLKLN